MLCTLQLNERSNLPSHITKSDFHASIFPVLACLVSYHYLLDKTKQVIVTATVRIVAVKSKASRLVWFFVYATRLYSVEVCHVLTRGHRLQV